MGEVIDFAAERRKRDNLTNIEVARERHTGRFGTQVHTEPGVVLVDTQVPPPVTHLDLKESNQAIRKGLAEVFGKQKFSVRGHSYAGGASTDVSWVDGPPESAVKEVTQNYTGGSFDGMTDMMSYHSQETTDENGNPTLTHYACDFVFTRRDYSESVVREAEGVIERGLREEGLSVSRNQPLDDWPQFVYRMAGDERHSLRRPHGVYENELTTQVCELIANERYAHRTL